MKNYRACWALGTASLSLAISAAFGADDAQPALGRIPTRWAKEVSPTNALPEYPRPQMARAAWQNLNGSWDYARTPSDATVAPTTYAGKILVPYPYEAMLSGVGKATPAMERLWYRRAFTVPAGWKGQRVLLHFGAVNYDSTVSVNGQSVGSHRGGYDAFSYDITDALEPGANEVVVSAWNPVKDDTQVVGKQRRKPGGIFYTAATGIWQTVWLEPTPPAHIADLKLTPDIDTQALHVAVVAEGADAETKVTVSAMDGRRTLASVTGAPGADLTLPVAHPHLWSPSDPHLYDLKISLIRGGKMVDRVASYFAMRKISLGKDAQGRTRLFLNNQFLLQIGTLDQGYWPDGIYTAPTDEALRYDIQATKRFGFNLIRKHAKVEPDRWYYWTDRLGMLVWQDMPQCYGKNLDDDAKAQWLTEWKAEIATHYNHPSIVVWTTFNEGWGEHDVASIVALTKQLDPSRLVNNASGWNDEHVGDIADTHHYPEPWSGLPEPTRAAVNGEYGGVTMRVPGHMWTTDVMGYGATLKSRYGVSKRYQELLKTAYRLADERGTSAFVYTQITDVEQESNGLLTYDRAVIKPDVAIITAADQGKFLPLPPAPVDPSVVVPTSEEEGAIWKYLATKPADNWSGPAFDDAGWKSGPAPFGHGPGGVRTEWTDTPGDIYLRREIILPAGLPAKLDFEVFHDEDIEIYVNGVLAASATGFNSAYAALPLNAAGRAALKPGKNLLAVHCRQTSGGQFIDVGISRRE